MKYKKTCANCGKKFETNYKRQKYCKYECYLAAKVKWNFKNYHEKNPNAGYYYKEEVAD